MTNQSTPQHIGRYEIERKIGEGASGVVYRARDPLLKRDVAIKVPKGDSISPEEKKLVTEAFYHEAAVAGNFTHPNIVTIFDVGKDNNVDFLVMEFVPGKPLDDYFTDTGIASVQECIDVIHKCCVALDYVHFFGIIHRDIKPGNVMYNRARGLVKLMDFSIAQQIENTESPRETGTLTYMAPEHFDETRKISMLTDLFALGSTMYRMLTGQRPFPGNRQSSVYRILNESPTPLSDYRQDIPDEVCTILNKAMAKQDNDRFQSALEFASALTEARSHIDKVEEIALDTIQWAPELEYYTKFRQNNLFRYFSPDQVQELLKTGTILNTIDGQVVIAEGDRGRAFYLLIDGRAQIMKAGVNISVIETGTCFGESSLIKNAPSTASVIADGDTVLWSIDADNIEKLSAKSRAPLYKTLIEIMMKRLEARTGEVAALHRNNDSLLW
jgi:serine/threonine protein kinase